MQADDLIPNNWKGVPACVAVERGLLGADIDRFSDATLEPPIVSIQYFSFSKIKLMITGFEVDVFRYLRFLFRESSPEITVSLAYIEFLTSRVITTAARDMIYSPSDVSFE